MWYIKKLQGAYTRQEAGFAVGDATMNAVPLHPWIVFTIHDNKVYPYGGFKSYREAREFAKQDYDLDFQISERLYPSWLAIIRKEFKDAPSFAAAFANKD